MRESVRQRVPPGPAGGLPWHVRMQLRHGSRGLPAPVCDVAVERAIEVPAGDGVPLLTDHYRPRAGGPGPALLVRSPYGRGFPWDYMYGALFASQGYHVLIQSCRGTGGSGGRYQPFVAEAADGQAAVAWLRQQEWFSGELATIGASYLGFTQWALALDPPPELRAMIVQVSMDDFYAFLYPGGAFALESTLTATAAMLAMERGFARFVVAMSRLLRHYRRVTRKLPLIDAYPAAFGQRAGYFEDWLAHPESADPYWIPRRAPVVPELLPPASLLTGWSDVCLDATLALYRRLRAAGREVRLTVGPWNHASGFSKDMPVVFGEALTWLRAQLAGDRSGLPRQPVRVHVGEIGGPGQWRDLPDWPPPDVRQRPWYPDGEGSLAAGPPLRAAVSPLHYDPADPPPAVGGPRLDQRGFGPQRNDALEARPDVLTFTSDALSEPLEVIGDVSARLYVRGSSPHFDVFARLCDVDPQGHSWNVCDGLLRLAGGRTAVTAGDGGPAGGEVTGGEVTSGEVAGGGVAGAGGSGEGWWRQVTVPMSATAHRFGAGHRLRLQLSGGAHPRFLRNPGTGDPPATAARLVPVDIEFRHDPAQPATLTLPTAAAPRR